jgi:hypothetical protein
MSTSQYNGTPINYCQTQSKTLKKSRFKLKIAAGESSQTYQHTKSIPINNNTSTIQPKMCILVSQVHNDHDIYIRSNMNVAFKMNKHQDFALPNM